MSKGAKRKWLYFFSLLIGFIGAISIITSLQYDGRGPAAIPSSFSWQDIENKQRQQILSVTDLIKEKSTFTLQVGDVVDSSLCTKYKSVRAEFTAEGVAVSGNKPSITLSTNCTRQAGGVRIIIPITEITEKPVHAQTFPLVADPNIQVKIENVIGFWPETWTLNQITFYNDEEGQKFSVTKEHMQKYIFTMNFNIE